jgi:putative oxidoreductase
MVGLLLPCSFKLFNPMKLLQTNFLYPYRDIILLFVRLLIAAIFLYHGWPKATDPQMASTKFEGMGFPGFLGAVVGWIEVISALLLILGWFSSLGNILLIGVIILAIIAVQISKGWVPPLERDLQVLLFNLVLLAFGPGRYSVDSRSSKTST